MGLGPIAAPEGRRRPLEAEPNLVPFIDLRVCCICFLLITAAWSQMARVDDRAGGPNAAVRTPSKLAITVAVADDVPFRHVLAAIDLAKTKRYSLVRLADSSASC